MMFTQIKLGHGIGEIKEIPEDTQSLIKSALEIFDEYSKIMKQAKIENPEIFQDQ